MKVYIGLTVRYPPMLEPEAASGLEIWSDILDRCCSPDWEFREAIHNKLIQELT
jgi:hypothetical protein